MKYLIASLVAVGMIVLVFVLFVSGGSKGVSKPAVSLYNSSVDAVRLTIDGPEFANQSHSQAQINVSPSEARINILQGYQGTVVNSVSYINNQAAYDVFLHSLTVANVTKIRSASQTDERGICALGDRYIFEVISSGKSIQRLWATSCGGQGTFGGNLTLATNLFEKQIPDFSKLTDGLDLTPQTVTLF